MQLSTFSITGSFSSPSRIVLSFKPQKGINGMIITSAAVSASKSFCSACKAKFSRCWALISAASACFSASLACSSAAMASSSAFAASFAFSDQEKEYFRILVVYMRSAIDHQGGIQILW